MDTITAAEACRWWSRVSTPTRTGRDPGLQLRRPDRGFARTDQVDATKGCAAKVATESPFETKAYKHHAIQAQHLQEENAKILFEESSHPRGQAHGHREDGQT